MPIRRCATPEDVAATLDAVQTQQGEAFFVFFGSEDDETGESWCPDCVTADPVIRGTVTKMKPDVTLYECPVGVRSAWKAQPDHPFRVHPLWQLERIPTLVYLRGGVEVGRLVEASCSDEAAVSAFLSNA